MIAAVSLMRRRADISAEKFRAHWLHPHGTMTAELPGLRRYWQSHVVASPASNVLAHDLGIVGFPSLWFDSIEARQVAYSSPRIAECNVDSEAFVGAVKRLATEPREVVRAHWISKAAKVVVLAVGTPDAAWAAAFRARALALPGVVGFIGHRLIEQAAAPNSQIPALEVDVVGFAEVTFSDEAARLDGAHRLANGPGDAARIAVFAVEDYRLV